MRFAGIALKFQIIAEGDDPSRPILGLKVIESALYHFLVFLSQGRREKEIGDDKKDYRAEDKNR